MDNKEKDLSEEDFGKILGETGREFNPEKVMISDDDLQSAGLRNKEDDTCDCPVCQLRRKLEADPSIMQGGIFDLGEALKKARREKASMTTPMFDIESQETVDFTKALASLKSGKKAARGNWEEDRAMFYTKGGRTKNVFGKELEALDCFMMIIGDKIIPFNPSTEDILAEDWLILK